jgi:nicotinamide mononucleotide (NMN) deamidase PncC
VARLLAARGLTLALADNVTQGEVAERLEKTSHAGVLVAKEYSTDEGVTPQESQGVAAIARADAAASLGLALLSTVQAGDDRPRVYLSLSDGEQIVTRSYQFGGESKLTRRWISIRALDLVRRYLLNALDEETD